MCTILLRINTHTHTHTNTHTHTHTHTHTLSHNPQTLQSKKTPAPHFLQSPDLRQLLGRQLWWSVGSQGCRVRGWGGWWVEDLDQYRVGHKADGADAMAGTAWRTVAVHLLEEVDGGRLWSVVFICNRIMIGKLNLFFSQYQYRFVCCLKVLV